MVIHNSFGLIQGEFYHFFNRANSQTDLLFYQERNYGYFLEKWVEYTSNLVEVWSYCLMPNHFHFLLRINARDNILKENVIPFSEAWRRLAISYTQAINKQESRRGSLFQEHSKYLLIESEPHLLSVIRYIHNNPVHHGLTQGMEDWRYSSYRAFFMETPSRIARSRVLRLFGDITAFEFFHHQPYADKSIDYCLVE